jgi:hypothetical protein
VGLGVGSAVPCPRFAPDPEGRGLCVRARAVGPSLKPAANLPRPTVILPLGAGEVAVVGEGLFMKKTYTGGEAMKGEAMIRIRTMIRIRRDPDVIKIYPDSTEGEYRELDRQDIERLKEVMEDLRDVKEIVIYEGDRGNRIEVRSENYAVHFLVRRNVEEVVAEFLGVDVEDVRVILLAPKILRVEKLR